LVKKPISEAVAISGLGPNLLLRDGEAYLAKSFFPAKAADQLFDEIIGTTTWRQDTIKMFGRAVLQPRLTA
jgi:hypothetical protein